MARAMAEREDRPEEWEAGVLKNSSRSAYKSKGAKGWVGVHLRQKGEEDRDRQTSMRSLGWDKIGGKMG